jgi:hypothetical protein
MCPILVNHGKPIPPQKKTNVNGEWLWHYMKNPYIVILVTIFLSRKNGRFGEIPA